MDAICCAVAVDMIPDEYSSQHLATALSNGVALLNAKLVPNGRMNTSASLCNLLNSTRYLQSSNSRIDDTPDTPEFKILLFYQMFSFFYYLLSERIVHNIIIKYLNRNLRRLNSQPLYFLTLIHRF